MKDYPYLAYISVRKSLFSAYIQPLHTAPHYTKDKSSDCVSVLVNEKIDKHTIWMDNMKKQNYSTKRE